jgi:hypothetical protein
VVFFCLFVCFLFFFVFVFSPSKMYTLYIEKKIIYFIWYGLTFCVCVCVCTFFQNVCFENLINRLKSNAYKPHSILVNFHIDSFYFYHFIRFTNIAALIDVYYIVMSPRNSWLSM